MGKLVHHMAAVALSVLSASSFAAEGVQTSPGLDAILQQIEQLEANSEPKCYATASRLEDFMFGTPLTDKARFAKNLLQKQWIEQVWQQASEVAGKRFDKTVSAADIQQVVAKIFRVSKDNKGHWQLKFNGQHNLSLHKDDKRQYGSIAYSLRAILAVQQQNLLATDKPLLPLSNQAVDALSDALDFVNLSALKVADQQARNASDYEVDEHNLEAAWHGLTRDKSSATAAQLQQPKQGLKVKTLEQMTALKSMVEQKMRSYAQYNEVNTQLFVRNLQVYFARSRWPEDPQQAREFRQMFTETLIAFSADLYRGAQSVALKNNHLVITEEDVNTYAKKFIPHRINEYEDAIFFPNLAKEQRVVIEAYDMDAFRDSGLHWRYLEFAIKEPQFKAYLEPDPFAAELLVENIAQFGVLLLRVSGDITNAKGEPRLKPEFFAEAAKQIQQRINDHAKAPPRVDAVPTLVSAKKATAAAKGELFSDVTAAGKIDFMHRSADWLSRQLRSYLKTGENQGTATIPPAFGGGGVAAEDINNDGLSDILLLSGLGNKLYLNRGNGEFEDVTEKSGLDWRRKDDKQPGEPRQPIIADLDNDGLQDIVITYVNDPHRVYRNLGDGKFEDVTTKAGLGGEGLVGGPATVFDFDNDGLLDIYITYFGDYLNGVLPTLKRRNTNGTANQLFHNQGGFSFSNVTKGSELDNTGWGQAVVHTDFDGDGMQDLIVGNDFGVNSYYRNLGQGHFEDISNPIGVDKPSYTMGIGTADLNGDLLPDVYISNIVTMNKDEKYIMPGGETTMKFNPKKLSTMRVVEANDLFISEAKDKQLSRYISSLAVERGYNSTGWSWDADFFDYDNDGDEDLYVLNGMNEYNVYGSENPYYTDPRNNDKVNIYIPVSSKESNVFFINENGKLNNRSEGSGVNWLGNSRSAAYFDLEGDGDLDIVVNNYHDKALLYRNNSERMGNHWLSIRLQGAPSHGINLDAIGAQIVVTKPDGSTSWREVKSTTGYMSVHPKRQYIGLGEHERVDITIRWPNGERSVLKGVKADQQLTYSYELLKGMTQSGE